jgi:hypothetical protein
MNRYITLLLFIVLVWGNNNQDGPNAGFFPGGYIGTSYEFNFKNKIRGLQISFGVALPSIGNPGLGPYLFPGLALGTRSMLKKKKSYHYSDIQINYLGYGGLWGGAGVGIAFMNGKKLNRRKIFGGYLMAGLVKEKIQSDEKSNTEGNNFFGYHLGLAIPLIGSHLYP